MKVFTCTDHEGHWVDVASVVVAENEQQAFVLLKDELERQGLADDSFTLKELDVNTPKAIVLCDGEY